MLNSLYMRVALDWDFLERVIGNSVQHVDEFQKLLFIFWKKTRDEVHAVSLRVFLGGPAD
jgi:glutathione synthase